MSNQPSKHLSSRKQAVSTSKPDVIVLSNQPKDIFDYAGTVPPVPGVDAVISREFMEKNYKRV